MTGLLKLLSVETGLTEAALKSVISTAPDRYKEYLIPKKNGGTRRIAHPAKELKMVQRALVAVFLNGLPIHPSASAYIKGKSIRDNALTHKDAGPLLKMDFNDFFPSIRSRDWISYCQLTGCLADPDEIELTTSLLFRRPAGGRVLRLAIGAPSSPTLSNVLMYSFDELLSERVSRDHVLYTRYADDLTFSAPRTGHLNSVQESVRKTLKEISFPTLTINHGKTTEVTKKYRRTVTGLTISNDGRVTLGRDRKRILRATIHKFTLNELSHIDSQKLAGHLAFAKSAEPEYFEGLLDRYGIALIKTILSYSNRTSAK